MSYGYHAERDDVFATPIWRYVSEGRIDNRALEAAVKEVRQEDPTGTRLSNVGGWQSQMYLHREEASRPLVEYVLQKAALVFQDWGFDFQGYQPVMNTLWASVSQGDNLNVVHHHWGFTLQNFNLLSGAYYVKCNERSGRITFNDERPSSKFVLERSRPFVRPGSRFIGERFSIQPNEGDLAMFPSWLDHLVTASTAEQERISMSFNISLPHELCRMIYESRRTDGSMS
jgi:uncharacterized protein (TIGR02466 family)